MSQLLPYETIVKASEGDPEAVAAVLSHYAGYIRSCAKMDRNRLTWICRSISSGKLIEAC